MSDAEGGAPAAGAPEGAPAQDLYREKPASKVVRIMTVMAYLTSVSFAAILLSVYYICIWKSPEAPKGDDPGYLLARQGTHRDYEPAYYSADVPADLTGRGDTTVSGSSENSTESTPKAFNYTSTQSTPDTSVSADADAPDASAPALTSDASAPTLTPDTSARTSTPDVSAPTLTPATSARRPANLTVDT